MRLLLVRHGQSEWNAGRVLQGQADTALSDLGRAQAAALAPVVAALAPDRAVTSDLARATETARILGHPRARRDRALREIDVGIWQGRSIDDLVATEAEFYAGWRAGTHRPDGGEDWAGFVARVGAALRAEIDANEAGTLLVVCHGGVIRAALDLFLSLRPQHVLPVSPASLTAIKTSANGAARLELYNFRPGAPELGAPD
ncbi:MAG TPA: histidine phosphatase family protein [Paracoccaceae bacterium]|nr:histidine phosphatase family protein [Paracoccaceae bacterium]HMO70152.1 histidine phosphatase family protein [Paracoccaceae bacterium]